MTHATLVLRHAQTTALNPRLQQSVRLLQLSHADFMQELTQALETNPFLEVPESGSALSATDDPHSAMEASHPETVVDHAASASPASNNAEGAADGPASEGFDDGMRVAVEPVADASDGLDAYHDRPSSHDHGHDGPDAGDRPDTAVSIRDHLHDALVGCRLDDRERALAAMIVESLDDDGYLRQELTDVAACFAFTPPVEEGELAIALERVQQLGPLGVAARSVAECLTLQLDGLRREAICGMRHDGETLTAAALIARDHLQALAVRDWAGLQRAASCDAQTVTAAVALIRSLDPRPGAAFDHGVAQAILPDVIVHRTESGLQADINPAVIPRIALNRVYAALFHDARHEGRHARHASSHASPAHLMGQQLQEARWLMHHTAQRFVTIRRVARAIVEEQTAFFAYGDIAVRPLLLRQIAERLELHESTISRAIGNKFMATPRGVLPFKHFFSRKLATVSGGSCSATSIRAAMRDMIDQESRDEPLSDVTLARQLGERGLCVARRTVTKYRALMQIPPVDLRRDLA